MAQTAGTVFKALKLLDAFLEGATELSLRELTERGNLNKTTTLRLCATLEAAGFLERQAGSGYRLGPKIWQLSQVYRRGFRLEDVIRPKLIQLRDKTNESVSFYVIDREERICRFRENSRLTVRHHIDEGTRFALGQGVAGRVLVAFGTTQDDADLNAIRKAGFLIARGREPHTTSVAVPLHDARGTLHGTLVISGPAIRFGPDAAKVALVLLQAAAAEIAAALPDNQSGSGGREGGASSLNAGRGLRSPRARGG